MVASLYTPSNSTLTRLSRQPAGALNVLRYQPTPFGKKPPPAPLGLSLSGLASILQSCGRSTVRHAESANAGASAALGSPSRNFQPESADSSSRGDFDSAACNPPGASDNTAVQIAISKR